MLLLYLNRLSKTVKMSGHTIWDGCEIRMLAFWLLLFWDINPFCAGTALMLMQTGWIQASCRVTRRLAWDPTCLPLSLSLPMKNKQNLQVLNRRRQYNLFLENYPAFKGLIWFMTTFKSTYTWIHTLYLIIKQVCM